MFFICSNRNIAAFTAIAFWWSASAQEADSVVMQMQHISDVTVVGHRSYAATTSSTPFQSLSAEQINALGITDMGDAVRRFAGVSVKDYGGIGGLKTVSVRNMGAAHTAVSYDGVSVSNTQAGQIDIGRFPLDNVAMMSLVIGQSDNLLQSARMFAAAGVLNIVTMRPEFKPGRNNEIAAKLTTGSFGLASVNGRLWQKAGARTSLSVDANYLRADGNYPFKLHNGATITNEHRNNSAIESQRIEVGMFHDIRSGGTLDVKGLYYHSRRGLPGAVIYYNPKSTERLWDTDAFIQACFRKALSKKWRFQAQIKYAYGETRHKGTGIEFVDGFFRETMHQNEYYISTTALYNPSKWFSVSLAQDEAVNTLRTSFPENQNPRRLSSITALNARFEPNDMFRLQGGATFITTCEHVSNGKSPDNFHRLAPTVALRLKPIIQQEFYLRLMAKSTFRLPTFNDMYYYRIGNTSLRPEKAREFNAGVTYSSSVENIAWIETISVSADGYINRITDKIVAIPTTFAWKMQNFGRVHAGGIDVNLQTVIQPTRWLELTLQSAYTWQKALDMTDKDSKSYRNQLPYTPRNNGNISLTAKTPWLTIGYSAIFVGKRYFLAQNLPANEISGYADQSLSIQREFVFKKCWNLNLKADLINIADEQYDVIKYYPMPGRNWRLSATLVF